MRPVFIVLVVAALAAGLTAFLAKSWLEGQATGAARQEAPATAEILVAARDVAAGTVLQADDLRYDKWPVEAVSPRLVVRTGGEDAKAAFLGQMVRQSLFEGLPFSPAAIFRTDTVGVMAGLLAPGMRAVSISITNPSAVSGFITPGDRVDVVLAADLQRANEGGDRTPSGGFMARYVAETVLSDIKVLAIDQQIARGRDGAAIQGKTATVEVTPKQAEILTAAGMLGSLQLVLRGQPDPKAVSAPAPVAAAEEMGFTSDAEVSKALQVLLGAKAMSKSERPSRSGGVVQINRAGQVSNQGFDR